MVFIVSTSKKKDVKELLMEIGSSELVSQFYTSIKGGMHLSAVLQGIFFSLYLILVIRNLFSPR